MKKQVTALGVWMGVLVSAAAMLAACGSSQDQGEVKTAGSAKLALTATSASGVAYRLRNAVFQLSGTASAEVLSETDPDATSINVDLPAGGYLANLAPGWTMTREVDGVFEAVNAVLISVNPAPFTIQDQHVTPVRFRFRAGDDAIDLGNGRAEIGIDVEETSGAPPICTLTDCNGLCVDLLTDARNCGACQRSCSFAAATAIGCTNGVCTPTCAAGTADCDHDDGVGDDNGCETSLANPNNCTACGNACASGDVCTSAGCTPAPAQGVAVLTVPFTASGQIQRYTASHISAPVDLTNSTLTIRGFAPGATGGQLSVFVRDSNFNSGESTAIGLYPLNAGFFDFHVPIGGPVGTFEPSGASVIVIQVESGPLDNWISPTVVYIDSISSDNGSVADEFTFGVPPLDMSNLLTVSGSTLSWAPTVP